MSPEHQGHSYDQMFVNEALVGELPPGMQSQGAMAVALREAKDELREKNALPIVDPQTLVGETELAATRGEEFSRCFGEIEAKVGRLSALVAPPVASLQD